MKYPKVKRAMGAARVSKTQIILGARQWGIGAVLTDDADETLWTLLSLMDGSRSRAAIVREMTSRRPDLDGASVLETVDALVAEGFVEDAATPVPADLEAGELERYERSRQYFAWIERAPRPSPWDVQCRLKRARVCVIGIGGAGGAVAASLVATGIGRVTCVDHDTVSVSNLNRTLLYSEQDVGQRKVGVAVRRLRQLNHHVDVRGLDRRIGCSADIDELMVDQDLVILCADEPRVLIGQWTNRAALRTHVPWQICLYDGPMVVSGIFVPGSTACWECIPGSEGGFPGAPDPELLDGEAPNAVIAPSANLTGHTGALLATYFLAGLPAGAVGRMFHHSLTQLDHAYYVDPTPEQCPTCGATAGQPRYERVGVAEQEWERAA
ncbi:MAG: molybdopterin-synthase adenylyltransferase [Solirubrobacteraceae bacterium]|nr:molybdopterin-synthase adenylyltransferase [Solirubrobacteraceae bacterium]